MRCDFCQGEITVYELYLRSYRLYIYLCRECKKGFLAHHFDLNLEIYQMDEVGMKEKGGLIFITGLKAEPRVFEFKVGRDVDVVVVCDEKDVLGELSLAPPGVLAPYSNKTMKRMCRLLGLPLDSDIESITAEVVKLWKTEK